MPLAKIPYKRLEPLLKKFLSKEEYADTKKLIMKLSIVKKRGYLKKAELIKICYWKSPRAIHHIKSNHEDKIKNITRKVFNTTSERRRLELLTSLSGVNVPMASSILMLTDPERYGVIDIRVWQLLFKVGTVKTNPKGKNFNFKEWYRYLMIIRYFAKKFKVKARDIERTLFIIHNRYQSGKLYENV